MKFSKRLLLFIVGTFLVASLFIGCSARKSMDMDMDIGSSSGSSPGYEVSPQAPPMDMGPEEQGKVEDSVEPDKIITTVHLDFETMEFEKTRLDLNSLISKHKAYIENSNISHHSSYKYGEFSIRIPRENLNSFRSELQGIGNIISENTDKTDVTKQYRDTSSRLKVITVKEERILSLLEKAEKIEDIIQLENQLSDTIYEKETLKASLLSLDDKVDYSTIYISIREVEKYRNTETIDTSFGTKVANAIQDSAYRFMKSLERFFIWLIYALPFIIVIGIVLIIVFQIMKKIYRYKNKS